MLYAVYRHSWRSFWVINLYFSPIFSLLPTRCEQGSRLEVVWGQWLCKKGSMGEDSSNWNGGAGVVIKCCWDSDDGCFLTKTTEKERIYSSFQTCQIFFLLHSNIWRKFWSSFFSTYSGLAHATMDLGSMRREVLSIRYMQQFLFGSFQTLLCKINFSTDRL